MSKYLTKSRFKLAIDCPPKLYYTNKPNEYADSKLDDPFLKELAHGGFQVGELAKYLFSEDPRAEKPTEEALASGRVQLAMLFGAALWAAIGLIAPAVATFLPGLGWLVAATSAASPEPSGAEGGDPRSNGQGPGLVGTPGLALLGVAAIAIVAIVATTVYVRITTPPAGSKTKTPPRR